MGKQNKKIENIEQLLAIAGSNLSVLEEEVDIKVQKEYFEMARVLSKKNTDLAELSKQYVENINHLFDEATDIEVKKKDADRFGSCRRCHRIPGNRKFF